jgi:uncharacterized membrane protein YagU involved in acid resistance
MEMDATDETVSSDPAGLADLAHGAVRGAVAAMAMTGMRALTVNAGIVEQPPPQAIVRQRVPGMGRFGAGRKKRRMFEELFHWGYGAGGGAAFAVLPEQIRGKAWAGPAYGVAIWLGFEVVIAPVLGLKQARQLRPAERGALLADHLLYGFVLSETRRHDRV